jgi:hypothetical protein
MRRVNTPIRILALAAATLLAAVPAFGDADALQKSFVTPPDDARMMARWWWFGPAVTKAGIERELQAMKAGGYGGFELQPVYPLAVDGPGGEGAQIKNLKFMSPEFLEAIGHAAATAKQLGLRFDLTLGSGWPYGGPQFSPSEGAGRLETQVLPAPAGQATIPVPQLQPGRTLIAAFAGPAGLAGAGGRAGARGGGGGGGRGGTGGGPTADVRGLKEVPVQNGAIQLPANFAGGEVVLFISGRTGMMVKRPATGAEGLVIDHLSAKVVDKFINEIAEPTLKACGPNTPYAFFCDSLEVGGENWTDDFLAEFQQRRGYDLKPLLPALIGNVGERTDDIRHDFGRTVTDLFNENFNAKFKALAKKYNTRFRIQGYGNPAAGLFSYAYADLPEGEAGGNGNWRGFRSTRYAASAAHLLGVKQVSSETFTWLHQAPFRASPLDIKGQSDTEFLDGINQFICHGWPYTGEGASYPGWSFYAAGVFNDKNPWWIAMPDINNYIARTSHLLREGTPANDIALYLPDADVWSRATTGWSSLNATWQGLSGVATQLLDAGYNFDGIDDGMLAMKGKVDGGTLAFGDVKYKVVMLPAIEHMPLETAKALEQFARGGGLVVALRTLPSKVPGYKSTPADDQELQGIMQRLFRGEGAPGLLIEAEGTLDALEAKLPPDVKLNAPLPGIGHVHRHTDAGELYFVANTTSAPQAIKATFRVPGVGGAGGGGKNVELWDPLTGKVQPAAVEGKTGNATTVALNLSPYGSTFVLFTDRSLPAPAKPAGGGAAPVDLSTDWTVTFGEKTVPMGTLQSWTQLPGMANYSGVATYEKKVTLTPEQAGAGYALAFAMGNTPAAGAPAARGRGGQGFSAVLEAPVREAAVVYVNGQRAGAAWCPPYRVDLSGLLKPGENTIRMEVANTAVNHIAGAGFPNYNLQAIRAQYGNRFDPQGTQHYAEPLPSGVLGTVRLETP